MLSSLCRTKNWFCISSCHSQQAWGSWFSTTQSTRGLSPGPLAIWLWGTGTGLEERVCSNTRSTVTLSFLGRTASTTEKSIRGGQEEALPTETQSRGWWMFSVLFPSVPSAMPGSGHQQWTMTPCPWGSAVGRSWDLHLSPLMEFWTRSPFMLLSSSSALMSADLVLILSELELFAVSALHLQLLDLTLPSSFYWLHQLCLHYSIVFTSLWLLLSLFATELACENAAPAKIGMDDCCLQWYPPLMTSAREDSMKWNNV